MSNVITVSFITAIQSHYAEVQQHSGKNNKNWVYVGFENTKDSGKLSLMALLFLKQRRPHFKDLP